MWWPPALSPSDAQSFCFSLETHPRRTRKTGLKELLLRNVRKCHILTTLNQEAVFINPLEKLQADWTTCDGKEDGAETPTQSRGKRVLLPLPCHQRSHARTAQHSPVRGWTKCRLLGTANYRGRIPGDTHPTWAVTPGVGCRARGSHDCLPQSPLPPSKYHPGKQKHYKTQQPTSCRRCSHVSIPCLRRTLGTTCPSQLQRFSGKSPCTHFSQGNETLICCRVWFIWATAITQGWGESLSKGACFSPVTPKGAQLMHRLVLTARWITSDAFLPCEMKCSRSAAVTSHCHQSEGLFDQWFLAKQSLQSSQGLEKGQNFRVLCDCWYR